MVFYWMPSCEGGFMSASEKAGNTAEGWNRGAAQAGYGQVRAGGWASLLFARANYFLLAPLSRIETME
ncbi:hypothetical protein K060079A122_24910 [Alistipes onderdonkii]